MNIEEILDLMDELIDNSGTVPLIPLQPVNTYLYCAVSSRTGTSISIGVFGSFSVGSYGDLNSSTSCT